MVFQTNKTCDKLYNKLNHMQFKKKEINKQQTELKVLRKTSCQKNSQFAAKICNKMVLIDLHENINERVF